MLPQSTRGVDFGGYAIRLSRYEPGRAMERHAHERGGISVVLGGALVEEAEHRSVIVGAGYAVVKPRGVYHSNRFGPAGALLLAIDFDAGAEPELFDLPALRAWRWTRHAGLLRAGLRLARALASGEAAEDLVHDLVAAAAYDAARARPAPAWLGAVRAALDESAAPPTVGELARRAGCHRAHLARAFREAFGMSVRDYRRLSQVRRAGALMASTRRSLSEIAHDCGFSDHSHMCRAFVAVAGVPPARFRASLRG